MAYYFDGVKCDTLKELNALLQSRSQPMTTAYSSKSALPEQRAWLRDLRNDCNRRYSRDRVHAHSSFAG